MKKLLLTLMMLVSLVLALVSCGGESADDGKVTIFSPEQKPTIIFSRTESTAQDREAYNGIEMKLRLLIPKGYLKNDDSIEPFGPEIIVGRTNRPASVKAAEYLESKVSSDPDIAAYVVCVDGNSIALLANNEVAMPFAVQYFLDNYLTDSTLTLDSDLMDMKFFSLSEYYADKEEELDAIYRADFEKRWDNAATVLGQEGVDALKRLYDYYGTDWAEWLYNLYDPETGAFYYSNSARDYVGFLPDCESTAQALGMLRNAGLFERYGNDWMKAIPEEMREKCVAFIQSLQSESDGYFYHPQWGTNIGTSRKGRDLNQCLSLLERFDAKPLYPSALDRLESRGTAAISELMSDVTAASYLDSEEEMLAYLEGLKINENSYNFGHTISSQTSQIKAAGLAEFVCDYIDAHQDPETGLWEDEVNYQSASGVIKIAAFYGTIRGAIRHGDKMLESLIGVILSDEDSSEQITYVFNPWGALSAAMSSIRLSSDKAFIDAAQARVRDLLPEMIDKTIEKLEQYRKPDGSYSYRPDRSSPTTQGVLVSLGVDEGDVNATACANDYLLGALFPAIGIARIPMLSVDDYREFISAIENMKPVEKAEVDLKTALDFEDGDVPTRVTPPMDESSGSVTVVTDPTDAENYALRFVSNAGTGTQMLIDSANVYTKLTCFTVSMDILVESADAAVTHQISIVNSRNNNRKAYMFDITVGGGMVTISESTSESSDTIKTFAGITEQVGKWFNLRLEYYPDGSGGANIKMYKNGICVHVSSNHYDIQKGYTAISAVDRLRVYAMRAPASSILIDNVSFDASTTAEFDPSDLKEGAGIVEEPTEAVGKTLDFESGMPEGFKTSSKAFSVAPAPTAASAGNHAFLLNSAAGSYDAINYSLPNGLTDCTAFALEMDMMVETATSDYVTQILLYNGNTQVYMLSRKGVE